MAYITKEQLNEKIKEARSNSDDTVLSLKKDREVFGKLNNYWVIEKLVTSFENRCNLAKLQEAFGEKEGIRLSEHWIKCGGDLSKFKTYLTRDDYQCLMYNIVNNETFNHS